MRLTFANSFCNLLVFNILVSNFVRAERMKKASFAVLASQANDRSYLSNTCAYTYIIKANPRIPIKIKRRMKKKEASRRVCVEMQKWQMAKTSNATLHSQKASHLIWRTPYTVASKMRADLNGFAFRIHHLIVRVSVFCCYLGRHYIHL